MLLRSLFNNASGSQCRFWSGDGVGHQDLGFIVADQNDTPITPNDSIALFLSVWMQLRQPMSHFALAYQYYRSKTDRGAV